MRRALHFALLGLCSALVACDQVGPSSMPACDRRRCSDACLDLGGPSCDVLESSCQARIFAAAQCVRGTEGTLPEVRVLTEEEYRAENEPDAGEVGWRDQDGGVGRDGGLEQDAGADADLSEGVSAYYRGLSLLGLYKEMPPVDFYDNLAGVYVSEKRDVTLIDRGQRQDSSSAQITLAHEFVHALQDQQVGLAELWRASGRSTDASLARGCLVEGEAKLYEELAWVLLQGLSVDFDYWDQALDWSAKGGRDQVGADSSPINQLWLLRYATGARFLRDAWLSGGNAAVRRIFDAPPNSTLFWMLGYEDSQTRTEPLLVGLTCVNAQAPAGFAQVNWDTLGAFSLYAFLSRNIAESGPSPNTQAWELAKTWRQDEFAVFTNDAQGLAVSWRLRFVDANAATAIETLLQNTALDLRIVRRGDELELLAAEGGAIKGWKGTDPANCPIDD